MRLSGAAGTRTSNISPRVLRVAAAERREGRSGSGSVRPQRDSPGSVSPGGEGRFRAESAEAGPARSGRNGGNPSASR